MHQRFIVVVTISIISFARLAVADGLFLNGVSPRSIGRGGTNIGYADNGAIIFDNPAAMTNIKGSWLTELGVDVLITDFEYEDPNTAGTSHSSIGTALPQIAVIKKSQDGHWAYGFGVFTPAGFSESYTMNAGGPFTGEQNYDSFGSLTKVLPAIAWAPNDRLSIGGTVGVAISHVEFETPYYIPNPIAGPPVVPLLLDLQGTGAAFIWSTGLQYKVSDSTTLGLTYQSESRFKLDGPSSTAIPGVGLIRFDADTRITWPQSLGLGLKHQVNRKGTFSADVIWFDWSSSFDDIRISLNATAPPSFPDVNESVPLDWKDTVSVRLGYEIDLGSLRTVRFGYVYHRNPIPSSTTTPLIQAITEHGFSTGYGFEFYGMEIDLAYMLTVGEDAHVASSDLLGGDFDDSRHGAVTHAISIGAIKRF